MSDTAAEATEDKREFVDRRKFTWRTVVYGFLRSRRHKNRRDDGTEVIFLDWHHPWLFFLAVGTMVLSCVDAFLTLRLMDRGMVEANPFMAGAMGMSTVSFTVTKLLLTAFGIFILVFLAKARFLERFRVGLFLTIFFTGYACLVCYELINLFKLS